MISLYKFALFLYVHFKANLQNDSQKIFKFRRFKTGSNLDAFILLNFQKRAGRF